MTAPTIAEKRCPCCRRTLATAEFSRNRTAKDGLQTYCRQCQATYWHPMRKTKNHGASAPESKLCSGCSEVRPSVDFYRCRTASDGLQYRCIDCQPDARQAHRLGLDPDFRKQQQRERRKRWADRNPDRERAKLLRKYGLTLAEYDRLWELQCGQCPICLRYESDLSRKLCVDHCHTTGEVRGLLCNDCNQALGKLGDDLSGVERAIAYLGPRS